MTNSGAAGSPLDPRDVDPYRAPQSGSAPDPSHGGGGRAEPRDWEPVEALRFGFDAVKRYPISILAAFVASLVGSLVGGIGGIAQNLLGMNGDQRLVMLGFAVYGVCMLLNIPLAAWMGLGEARFGLALASGERPELSVLFRGDGLLAAIGVQCLYFFGGVMLVGVLFLPAILLVVQQWPDPGIEALLAAAAGGLVFAPVALYVAARICLANCAIAERRMGAFEAISESWRMTSGQLWPFVLFFLLFFVLAIVSYVAGLLLCCVGVLVTVPAAMMVFHTATGYAYWKRGGVEPVLPPA